MYLLLFLQSLFFSHASNVLEINDSEFSSIIRKRPSFIVFYQKWCGYSKNFLDVLESAAENISTESVFIGKIDCANSELLCHTHVVKGYPTSKLFQNGDSILFNENRTVEGITSWLNLHLLPPYTKVSSEEEANKIKLEHDFSMIGYFQSDKDPEFTVFANSCETTQTKAARIAVISESITHPKLLLFHRAENEVEEFTARDWTVDSVSRFEQTRSSPFVEDVNPFTGKRISDSVIPTFYLFTDINSEIYGEQFKELKEAAKEVRDKMMVAVADTRRFGRSRVSFGIPETPETSYAIECFYSFQHPGTDVDPRAKIRFAAPTRHPKGEVVGRKELAEYMHSFLDGKLEPTLRSEEVPERQFGLVKKVVGQTFNEIVMDSQTDVLIRLITPWCFTCNHTEPIFQQIAYDLNATSHISDSSSSGKTSISELAKRIVLAEMDVSENDPPPEVIVRGHPTVLLFPAEDKMHPIICNDWFSYEKLKMFLRTELLKQPRWKGVDKEHFPLPVDEDAITDEDDLINFDYDVEKRQFPVRQPPPHNTGSEEL